MGTKKMPLVTKIDGTQEPFDERKLRHSLKRSGASDAVVETIVEKVDARITDGATTTDIYRYARSLLKTAHQTAAVKYSLRRALFSLGPTGFPFEDFLGALFHIQGYETKTGVILQGRCVEHEVDLIAYKKDHCFIAEAKFHAKPGMKSDLQVALYSHARFQDLKDMRVSPRQSCGIMDAYIITNTKFTHVAEQYARCSGIKLLSWNYPKEKTLQDHIEEAGIYPITALTSISIRDKQLLLENEIVLCKDMAQKRELLRHIGFAPRKIETMIAESVNLCTNASA